jgi:hypothetical protein
VHSSGFKKLEFQCLMKWSFYIFDFSPIGMVWEQKSQLLKAGGTLTATLKNDTKWTY